MTHMYVTTKPTLEKNYSDSVTQVRIPMPYHCPADCPVRQLLSKVGTGIQKTKKKKRPRVGSNHQPFGIMNKNNSRTR